MSQASDEGNIHHIKFHFSFPSNLSRQLYFILKSMYEVIILPVTIRVVKAIKKIDGSDVYDTDISYNVLKVKDIIR